MSAKIADLRIGIKNTGETAVKDLQDLATALKTIDRAKNSLDFSDISKRGSSGLQGLYQRVQSITRIMKPLATEMEKISRGFSALGIKANSVTTKTGASAIKETSQAINEKLAGQSVGADVTNGGGTLAKTADKLKEGEKASSKFVTGLRNVGNALVQTSLSSRLANSGIGRLVSSFGRLLKLKGLRMIVQEFYRSIGEGISNLYEYSRAIGSIDSANFKNTMDGYSTSMQTLRNTIGATIGQVITAMLPTIQTLINYLTTAINVINQFFAALQGKTVFTKAKDSFKEYAEATSSSAGGATSAVKELQRTILAFDELNVLNSPDTSSGSGGGGGGASTPDYTDMFEEADINEKIKKVADKVKEVINFIKENFETIWAIVSNIGLALLAWKIAGDVASFFSLFSKNAGKVAFGITLSLAGFAIETEGAYSIGKNGLDLKNAIQTALGASLGVIGGVISFGASSMLITIPLTILFFVAGFATGDTERRRAEDEIYQYGETLKGEISRISGEINTLMEGAFDTSSLTAIDTSYSKAKELADAIFDIAEQSDLSSQDVAKLKALTEEFNKMNLGDIQIEYNDTTGEISATREEIDNLVEAWKRQAKASAYLDIYENQYKAYVEISSLVDELEGKYDEAENALNGWKEGTTDFKEICADFRPVWNSVLDGTETNYEAYLKLKKLNDDFKPLGAVDMEIFSTLRDQFGNLEQAYKDADEALDTHKTNLETLDEACEDSWNNYVGYATGSIDEVEGKIDEMGDTYNTVVENIEGNPADFTADSTDFTTDANECSNLWNNKLKFKEQKLEADNKPATTSIENLGSTYADYKYWAERNPWSVVADTSEAGNSLWTFYEYWNNTSLSFKAVVSADLSPLNTALNKYHISGAGGGYAYAEGGYPDYGTMFIAGEAGAEMVGNINGRTGVASQGEITGIRQSVEATGNAEARLLAEQNALLRQILAKEGNVTISTSEVIKGLNRTNRRAGKTVVAMGQ